MSISMIAAMDINRTIGINNQLPWRLPADLAYFKKITMGHTVLMGRKTHESIGKPLPGRKNVVLTANRSYSSEGCIIIHSVEDALKLAAEEEVFVVGGAELYRLFLPYADRLYITVLEHEFAGDAFFPEIDPSVWNVVSVQPGITDDKNPYKYSFRIYEKKS